MKEIRSAIQEEKGNLPTQITASEKVSFTRHWVMLLHERLQWFFLFCRAIETQNKPCRPKTKHWRLILMLVWKDKQQHKHELVLPSRNMLLDIQLLSTDQKGIKACRYTRSYGVLVLLLNPYHQVQIFTSTSKLKRNVSCKVVHYVYKNCLFCNNSMSTTSISNEVVSTTTSAFCSTHARNKICVTRCGSGMGM
jgi:hypothetical protein